MPLSLRACHFFIRLFSLIWMLSATVQSHPPRRPFYGGDTSFVNPLWSVLRDTAGEAGVYYRDNLQEKATDDSFFNGAFDNEAESVLLLSKALLKQPSVLAQNQFSEYLPVRRLPYESTDGVINGGRVFGGRKEGGVPSFQKFWKDLKKPETRRRGEASSEKEDPALGILPVGEDDEGEMETNGEFKKRENRGGKLNLGLRLMCQVDSRNCPQAHIYGKGIYFRSGARRDSIASRNIETR